MNEKINEGALETKVTKTKKPSTTKTVKENIKEVIDDTKDSKKVEELVKLNQELRNKNSELENKVNEILEKFATISSQPQPQPQPIYIQSPKEKKYTVVNLTSDHNFLLLEAGNWKGTFVRYCDTREVTEDIFLEIVRKYGSYFADGSITTDSDGIEILKERRIKVATRWMTNSELSKIGDLNEEEIKDLLKKLIPSQKELFVEEFLNGIARKESKYLNINKLMVISQNYKGYKSSKLLKVISDIVKK